MKENDCILRQTDPRSSLKSAVNVVLTTRLEGEMQAQDDCQNIICPYFLNEYSPESTRKLVKVLRKGIQLTFTAATGDISNSFEIVET